MTLYKTATVAPGRSPANLAIYQDADQYYDQFRGSHVFDLISGYGCDPTGVTECSTNVLAAISDAAGALGSSPNGKSALIVGYGKLNVNKTISIASDNIMLMGLGGGEVSHMFNGLKFFKNASFTGNYILDFHGSGIQPLGGCRIKNVVIDGNSQSGTNVGGLRFSSYNGTVEDVHIGYCSGVGLEVVGDNGPPVWNTYNTCLNRVWSHNNFSHGFYINPPSTDGHATDIFAYYNGRASDDTTIVNSSADGFNLNSSGWQIYGYHAYSNAAHGLNVVGGVLACQCSGGYLENNGKAGIFFDNTSSGASGFRLVNNFIWDNSRTTASAFDNVQIGTAGAFGCSVIVSENHIRQSGNTPRYGINLPSGTAQNCIVTGNIVTGTYGTKAINSSGSSAAGSACVVANNQGHNPVGSVTAPSIPATGVATNPNLYPTNEHYTVYIKGSGTTNVTAIAIAGTTITGLTVGANQVVTIRVLAGQSVTLTYTVAPSSWAWVAD